MSFLHLFLIWTYFPIPFGIFPIDTYWHTSINYPIHGLVCIEKNGPFPFPSIPVFFLLAIRYHTRQEMRCALKQIWQYGVLLNEFSLPVWLVLSLVFVSFLFSFSLPHVFSFKRLIISELDFLNSFVCVYHSLVIFFNYIDIERMITTPSEAAMVWMLVRTWLRTLTFRPNYTNLLFRRHFFLGRSRTSMFRWRFRQ